MRRRKIDAMVQSLGMVPDEEALTVNEARELYEWQVSGYIGDYGETKPDATIGELRFFSSLASLLAQAFFDEEAL